MATCFLQYFDSVLAIKHLQSRLKIWMFSWWQVLTVLPTVLEAALHALKPTSPNDSAKFWWMVASLFHPLIGRQSSAFLTSSCLPHHNRIQKSAWWFTAVQPLNALNIPRAAPAVANPADHESQSMLTLLNI